MSLKDLLTYLLNQATQLRRSQFYQSRVYILRFYRAMHFNAKRGIGIACRLSVRLSVCL